MYDTSFVEKYHKKFKVSKHQISPIFKDDKNKYQNPKGLDSMSTLSEKEKYKVNKIVQRNL